MLLFLVCGEIGRMQKLGFLTVHQILATVDTSPGIHQLEYGAKCVGKRLRRCDE